MGFHSYYAHLYPVSWFRVMMNAWPHLSRVRTHMAVLQGAIVLRKTYHLPIRKCTYERTKGCDGPQWKFEVGQTHQAQTILSCSR